jgi:hypothetical protein
MPRSEIKIKSALKDVAKFLEEQKNKKEPITKEKVKNEPIPTSN